MLEFLLAVIIGLVLIGIVYWIASLILPPPIPVVIALVLVLIFLIWLVGGGVDTCSGRHC